MSTTLSDLDLARQLQEEIVAVRRHIHAHPELSFAEKDTAKLGANTLTKLGYEVEAGIGGTGVVANRGSGKIVAIRADMDGLPIQESNQVPYCSQNAGVMHACGHDAHVACTLSAAKMLAQQTLPGQIRILLQPAEESCDAEGRSGAYRLIEAGAMKDVAAIIGLHVDSSIPAGKVAILPGAIMAATDFFEIMITGKGGHGAYPETTVDAVVLASHVIQAAQQVVARKISPLEPAVLTIGSIHSSSERGNVISESCLLRGTLRSFNAETRNKLIDELNRACAVATTLGGTYTIKFEDGYPATVNDESVTAIMHETACELIGAENVIAVPIKTWGEDFSMLAQQAPGCFMFLGAAIEDSPRSHHSPNFDIDESGLYIGAAILARTAKKLLAL